MIDDDESCCDCTCEGGDDEIIVTCPIYTHKTEDGRGCIACEPTVREILDSEGHCEECPAYYFRDGPVDGFFTKCMPHECDLTTDILYIDGTCETCGPETIPTDDNTGCVPVMCTSR
jgi:hypothetical protein